MNRAILFAVLLLTACASAPPPGPAAGPQLTRNTRTIVSYGCADGAKLIVAYLVSPDSVEVTYADGRKQNLPNVIAASGARYAAAGVEFWSKGDEAMFTAPGKPQTTCNVAK